MVSALISKLIMLIFGTLFPAYRSYKAIKNKDVREYVKWMMYWIIFALFITVEAFADTFISWLPLYYEIKIIFIIWLLSPATKGSSILYRKFVHPRLVRHEKAIDKYLSKAQQRGYTTLMDVGKKSLNVATDTFLKTAATGQYQLIQTIKRYNSMQELRSNSDDVDAGAHQKRQTWHESMQGMDQPFNPEMDVDLLQRQYKPNVQENLIEEEVYESNEIQRSQSDLNLSHDASSSPPRVENDTEAIINSQFENNTDDGISMNVDYNYAYSSNTLPRARKSRKPLHETMPTSRTSRPRRTPVDKKTTS